MGNWSGLVSYPDDGGMKPARNGRKRYNTALKQPDYTNNKKKRESESEQNMNAPSMHVVVELINISTRQQRATIDLPTNSTANQRQGTN